MPMAWAVGSHALLCGVAWCPSPGTRAEQVVTEKLTGQPFDTAFVAQWTAQISESCLHGCRKLEKPFKFIGTHAGRAWVQRGGEGEGGGAAACPPATVAFAHPGYAWRTWVARERCVCW